MESYLDWPIWAVTPNSCIATGISRMYCKMANAPDLNEFVAVNFMLLSSSACLMKENISPQDIEQVAETETNSELNDDLQDFDGQLHPS